MAQVESVYPVRPATVEGNEVATMETAAADVEAVRILPLSLFDPKLCQNGAAFKAIVQLKTTAIFYL